MARIGLADKLGDQFVATEHLLIGLARIDSPAQRILAKAGATNSRPSRL